MRRIFSILSVIVAVAMTMLPAGCGEQITAEQIVAKLKEMIGNAADMHIVMTMEFAAEGHNDNAAMEMWEKRPNKFRMESTASDESFDVTVISDGAQIWTYDSASNRVIVGAQRAAPLLEDIPLPLSPEFWQDIEGFVQKILDEHDAKLLGEEEVADVDTYKLELTPKEGSGAGLMPGKGVLTLWIDKTAWIVRKAHYADTMGEATVTVQTAEFNLGLDDSLFTFTVPEGVEVVSMEDMRPKSLTLAEARERASFPLLAPTYLPDGATLVELFEVDGTIIMQYHLEDAFLVIVQGSADQDSDRELPSETSVEEVNVRGVKARLISGQATRDHVLLQWEENEITITVSGALDRAEILKIAEGLQ